MPLTLHGVAVRRGGRTVVEDLDWSLPATGWIGLVGANGSGKTSLLRALAGRGDISNGFVAYDGEVLATRYRRSRRVSMAPDIAALPASLTAGELLALFRAENGEAAGSRSIHDALDISRLGAVRIGAMSAGMCQRVAIYAAFLTQADVVLLDEPFNWLDPIGSYDFKVALRAFASDGRHCVVTALHDMATLTAWCDRGGLLRDGKLAWELGPDELASGRTDFPAFEKTMIERLRAR